MVSFDCSKTANLCDINTMNLECCPVIAKLQRENKRVKYSIAENKKKAIKGCKGSNDN